MQSQRKFMKPSFRKFVCLSDDFASLRIELKRIAQDYISRNLIVLKSDECSVSKKVSLSGKIYVYSQLSFALWLIQCWSLVVLIMLTLQKIGICIQEHKLTLCISKNYISSELMWIVPTLFLIVISTFMDLMKLT